MVVTGGRAWPRTPSACPFPCNAARITIESPPVTLRIVTAAKESARTAPIAGLSHVQLLVSSVALSARWYEDVLGVLPYVEDLDVGYVALRQPEAKFVIVLTNSPGSGEKSFESPGHGLDHLAFAVPNGDSLRAWAAHLSDLGIEHNGVVQENGHPSLQLRDPDGIAIELVAP